MSLLGLIAHFFLVLNNILLSGYIHSPEHVGCFQILAIINKAGINIHVQVFVWM